MDCAARIGLNGTLASTTQVSRYAVKADSSELMDVPKASPPKKAYNRPYLPQDQGGTVPFRGDHDDIVALGGFVWDSPQHFPAPGEVVGVRFMAMWGGDNREARFPSTQQSSGSLDGDWSDYQEPATGDVPSGSCNAGIRNSNNYAAYIGPPIEAFVNHSFKPRFNFGPEKNNRRTWVITVRNHSAETRILKYTVFARQGAGKISFDQAEDVTVIGNHPADVYCSFSGDYPDCTAYRKVLPTRA